jgi:hypothetical protein
VAPKEIYVELNKALVAHIKSCSACINQEPACPAFRRILRESALHAPVPCPNCHNNGENVEEMGDGELFCWGCGKGFNKKPH